MDKCNNINMLCEYGCGQEAKHYLKRSKKWCCSKSYNSCPIARQKNKEKHLGENNHRFGKVCSNETKNKISQANKGNIPWNKNKTGVYNTETLKKMSESRQGAIPWNKGKKNCFEHTQETKEKIRISSTGRKHSEEVKKKIGKIHKNKIVSYKTKQLMSENHWDCNGENNPNWKGGVSYEPYCEQWLDRDYKETIKKRDGYQCLNPCCYGTSESIVLHHIDYNKKNCHPYNLITLCNSCNSGANFERRWHKLWYETIIYNRYIK